MADVDVNRYLEPVSEDAPCGDNLEYDPLLQEIEKAAEGTAERVVGDSVLPGEDPDWRQVRRKSLEALERTRDIQVCVYLLRAMLQLDGLSGVAQGLQLIRGQLERYWDCVHPVQDEDDDYPVLRMNLLSTLMDREAFLRPLQHTPLTDSQVMGRYSLHDIELSKGSSDGDDEELPKPSQIEAAFMDTDLEALEQNSRDVDVALGEVQAMSTLTNDKVGAVNAPDFSSLITLLKDLQAVLREQLQRRGSTLESGEEADQTTSVTADGQAGQVNLHAINSREDVQKAIDAINDYFQRQDPSSPIPFLLKRVRRLLFMDFREILQELAPDGISQAETVFGAEPEEKEK